MGLALCHIVPRDRLLQLVILLLVAAFCLIAAAIGQRNRDGSLATLKSNGLDDLFLYLDGSAVTASGVTVCSNHNDQGICSSFVHKTRIGSLLVILGWILLTLAVMACCFIITPLAKHSYQIYLFFWISLIPAVSLIVAGCALFLGPSIKNGVDLQAAGQTVHYGRALRCVIAAMVLVCVGFLIATFQLISTIGRSKVKQAHIQERKIDEIMKMHIVNDDWTRQKMMWVKHAQAVDVELQQNHGGNGEAPDSGSITHAMEQPEQVTFKHTRTRSQAAADAMSNYNSQHFADAAAAAEEEEA